MYILRLCERPVNDPALKTKEGYQISPELPYRVSDKLIHAQYQHPDLEKIKKASEEGLDGYYVGYHVFYDASGVPTVYFIGVVTMRGWVAPVVFHNGKCMSDEWVWAVKKPDGGLIDVPGPNLATDALESTRFVNTDTWRDNNGVTEILTRKTVVTMPHSRVWLQQWDNLGLWMTATSEYTKEGR